MKEKNEFITAISFDFGLSSIGVAVGQSLTNTATPLVAIRASNGIPNWDEVSDIIKIWNPAILVVGKPLDKNNNPFPVITELSDNFCNILYDKYNINVCRVNEHLTTVEAKEIIFNKNGFKGLKKGAIDAKSAQLILEEWLKFRF